MSNKDLALPAEQEEWRSIVGYEGFYEVSSFGRARSLYFSPARILSIAGTDKSGYPILSLSKDRKRGTFLLHRLVCIAFNGQPKQPDMEAAHLDGCRANARADNLQWTTKVENHAHKRAHGTHLEGDTSPRRKLCSSQVIEIRAARGISTAGDLAQLHNVAADTIRDIWNRRRWPCVADAQLSSGKSS
jgi:hypothetical protein